MKQASRAVVLSCKGGDQGSLGVVQALGRAGVGVILVTENEQAHALRSRYVERSVVVPPFRRDPEAAIQELLSIGKREQARPVLFPTSDPDLELVSAHRDVLADLYHFTMPEAHLVDTFLDKGRFFEYGQKLGFPIARTMTPQSAEELRASLDGWEFPLILKPLNPKSWGRPEIRQLVDRKKAVLAADAGELIEYYTSISRYDGAMVVQEYVPGRDDALFSVHLFMSDDGEPLATFVGRKVRTYPAYAGIGCFVVSEHRPELIDGSIEVMKKSGYTGIALLQFKQDSRDGRFVLLEVNARSSSWNKLATACGVNIPAVAYHYAISGEETPVAQQASKVRYLYFKPDLLAVREYIRHGDWTVRDWLRSYRGRMTHQLLSFDDPAPFVSVFAREGLAAAGKIGRLAGRRVATVLRRH